MSTYQVFISALFFLNSYQVRTCPHEPFLFLFTRTIWHAGVQGTGLRKSVCWPHRCSSFVSQLLIPKPTLCIACTRPHDPLKISRKGRQGSYHMRFRDSERWRPATLPRPQEQVASTPHESADLQKQSLSKPLAPLGGE